MTNTNLHRLMNPSSVAVVGASEPRSDATVLPMLEADLEVVLVNPNRPSLYGIKTVASLAELGAPVDAVLSTINPASTLAVVQDAVDLGVGGVVITSAGFAEASPDGRAIQQQIADLARANGLEVCGPNCVGIVNFRSGARMSITPRTPVLVGRTAIASHSGGLMRVLMSAAHERRLGLNYLVSLGNEAVTDMVDVLEYLIDDPHTDRICLVIESVRRPAQFMQLAARAAQAGKPIIALKIGRGRRAMSIVGSHTGALASEAVGYEAMFRSLGILVAEDPDDLIDKARFAETMPINKWSPVNGLGVITMSGGTAWLASDTFEDERIPLPALENLRSDLASAMNPPLVLNPLDVSVYSQPERFSRIVKLFRDSPDVDALLFPWALAEHEEAFARRSIDVFREFARDATKPMIVASPDTCRFGDWTDEVADSGIGLIRGIPAARRISAMMRQYVAPRWVTSAVEPAQLPPPSVARSDIEEVRLAEFGEATAILNAFGITTAPHVILRTTDTTDAVPANFGQTLVVKLANVLHRHAAGALRLQVARTELDAAVAELRVLATRLDCDDSVVIQPMIGSQFELIAGIKARTPFGPVVVFGAGGGNAEKLRRIAARLAPLCPADITSMLRELGLDALLTAVQMESVTETLIGVSGVALQSSEWLDSIDLNPILVTQSAAMVVDVSFLLR